MDYVVVEEDKSFITDAFVEQVIVHLEKHVFSEVDRSEFFYC